MSVRLMTAVALIFTVTTALYVMVQPGAGWGALGFVGPLCAGMGAVTGAVWRSRLDLGASEIGKRGLLRSVSVDVDAISRVVLSTAGSSGEQVHVFVAGRRVWVAATWWAMGGRRWG